MESTKFLIILLFYILLDVPRKQYAKPPIDERSLRNSSFNRKKLIILI